MNTGQAIGAVAMASNKSEEAPLLNILAVDAESANDQFLSVFLRLQSEVNRLMGHLPESPQVAEKQPQPILNLPTDRINYINGQNFKLIAEMHGQINRLSRL